VFHGNSATPTSTYNFGKSEVISIKSSSASSSKTQDRPVQMANTSQSHTQALMYKLIIATTTNKL
jgi:hypothetical protein